MCICRFVVWLLILVCCAWTVSVGFEYESCPDMILWEKRTAILQGYESTASNLGGWSIDKHHALNIQSGELTRTHTQNPLFSLLHKNWERVKCQHKPESKSRRIDMVTNQDTAKYSSWIADAWHLSWNFSEGLIHDPFWSKLFKSLAEQSKTEWKLKCQWGKEECLEIGVIQKWRSCQGQHLSSSK